MGFFISFEGMDGSGKSTQIQSLAEALKARGINVLLTREPGGTPLGEKIRELLLDPAYTDMASETEMLLYAAARAQHVREQIAPALKTETVVISDRFLDSSLAYQGYGRQLGNLVMDANQAAVNGLMPDLTFYLDLPPEAGMQRIAGRGDGERDRLEQESAEFKNRVYAGFLDLTEQNPDRIVRIDGAQDPESIREEIFDTTMAWLARMWTTEDLVTEDWKD